MRSRYDYTNSIVNRGRSPRQVRNIKLPKNLKVIGELAFAECQSLEKIDIPEGTISIRENAFSNCIKLREINLPQSLKEIEINAFCGCKSLKKIRVSKNTHIHGYKPEIERIKVVRI